MKFDIMLPKMHLDDNPSTLNHGVFSEAFNIGKIANLNKEEQMAYTEQWMIELDYRSVMDYVKEEAMQKDGSLKKWN